MHFTQAEINIVQYTCILEKARLNGQYNCNLPGANEANLQYKTTNNISKQVAEKFKTTNIAIQKTRYVKSHHLSSVQTLFRISCNLPQDLIIRSNIGSCSQILLGIEE